MEVTVSVSTSRGGCSRALPPSQILEATTAAEEMEAEELTLLHDRVSDCLRARLSFSSFFFPFLLFSWGRLGVGKGVSHSYDDSASHGFAKCCRTGTGLSHICSDPVVKYFACSNA